MSKLWIFGDSFAVAHHPESWANILATHFVVENHATNGSSEYRIWRKYKDHAKQISDTDTVLFCHTSTSRVYLKDSETILSRLRDSHPFCDLIFADIFAKKENRFINILKEIWDDRYFEDTYKMLKDDLLQVPNSKHIDFFSRGPYNAIWSKYPGKINHMDKTGNMEVLKQIMSIL